MNQKLIKREFRLFFFLSIFMYTSFSIAQETAAVGSIEVIEGVVEIERQGQVIKAKEDDDVYEGDILSTGEKSHLKLLMEDENEFDLSEDSKFKIESYLVDEEKVGLLELLYGKLRSALQQKYIGEKDKFELRTPSSIIGVRGTDFLASYDKSNDEAEVTTFSGEVEAGDRDQNGRMQRPRRIKAGQFLQARKGRFADLAQQMDGARFENLKRGTRREGVLSKRQKFKEKFKQMRERRLEFRKKKFGEMKERKQEMQNKRQMMRNNQKPNRRGPRN